MTGRQRHPGPLGERQLGVLKSLIAHGDWHKHGGWVWTSPGQTEAILETLRRRGLVEKKYESSYLHPRWVPTDRGRAVVSPKTIPKGD